MPPAVSLPRAQPRQWLADAVEQGRIRYVLISGAEGMPNDGRVGAGRLMAAAEELGTPTTVDGLYDVQRLAAL